MTKSFLRDLREAVDGELRTDSFSRQIYSVDASIYEIEPIAIFLPRSKKEIQTAIEIAAFHKIPIIPRGAATGTTGGCIGPGLIIDLSKYFNQIHEIDIVNKFTRCAPGVIQDQLNSVLASYGFRLGPDTSTGNRATLGGMLANNSAGAHSLKYGKMVDHIEATELILSDGSLIHTETLDEAERKVRAKLQTPEGAIYRAVDTLITTYKDEIQKRFPNIPRHVSGYNLDELIKPGPLNLSKLIAGSEGTLGIATELKLRICEKPPFTGLSVIQFFTLKEALSNVAAILPFHPYSLEVIDKKVIDLGRTSRIMQGHLDWLQGDPGAILHVEFEGQSQEEVLQKHHTFIQWAISSKIGYAHSSYFSKSEIDNIWALRKGGVGLIMSRRTYSRAIAFLEDLSVPPEKLPHFIHDFEERLKKYGFEAGFYGHAGHGCIHVRPFVDLRNPQEIIAMKALMEEMTELIITYGGALSGEHGDGLVRSWLNEKLYGPLIYQAFKDIKHAFDPHGIMNPGKIIATQSLSEHLRVSPETHVQSLSTFLDFKKEGGFEFAVEMCNGNGQCRKREGLMCPTFQAYGDEYHSTRARAQSLRAVVNGKIPLEAYSSKELFNVLELCIECKGCKTECPSQVDMAKMKSEYLFHYQKKHGVPLRSKLFGHIGTINRLGTLFPSFYNWISQTALSKLFLKWLGVSPKRPLPLLASERFSEWARKQIAPSNAAKQVVLFCDTYTEYHHPHIGIAAYTLLQQLNYSVKVPQWSCCGRPLFSKGLLPEAKKKADHIVQSLYPFASQGIPIIVLEPSCLSMFRDDFRNLLPDRADVECIASASQSLDEFLVPHLHQLPFAKSISSTYALHTHCHQKALAGSRHTLEVLKAIPGATVTEIHTGCCGLAGSFGYESEHYDFSIKIGEDRLFPAIRHLSPTTVIVANGMSCRSQISHGTQREAKHLAEILLASLKKTDL